MFIIERCLRRFRHAWRYYIWVILELAAGAAILVCQDSVSIAAAERLEAYEQQFMENTVSVMNYSGEGWNWNMSELPVPYEAYNSFLEELPKDTELYCMQQGRIYLGIQSVNLIGMSENMFRHLIGFDMENTVWVGREALNQIKGADAYTAADCSVDDDTICLYGSNFSYRILEGEVKNSSIIGFSANPDADILTEESIFVPLELVTQIQEAGKPFYNSTLTVGGADYRERAEQIAELLEAQSRAFHYAVEDRRQVYQKNSKDFTDSIKIVGWIGRFALILTAVGIVGIMLIHLDERKKDFAISMVVGATRRRLTAETVFEIVVLCLLGGIAALGIAAVVVPMQSTSQYMVKFEKHSVGLLAVTILGMAALICVVLSSCVKIQEPAAALKEVNQ